MTGPVRLSAVLETASTRAVSTAGIDGPDAPASWCLVGSAGLWCAHCLLPGCAWTATTGTCEAAMTAATLHALAHPTLTSPTTTSTSSTTTGRTT